MSAQATELDLLIRDLREAAKPHPGLGMDAVLARVAAVKRGAMPPPAVVGVDPLAPGVAGSPADAGAPEASTAVVQPPGDHLVIPAPPAARAEHVATLVRVYGEMCAELRRLHGDAEDRLTEALHQVRARDPRFGSLVLDRPTAGDVVGLLHVLDAAIGPAPPRMRVFARRGWLAVRVRFTEALLEVYNAGALPDDVAAEVEALWLRLTRELEGR